MAEIFRADTGIHTNPAFISTLASPVSAGAASFTVAAGDGSKLPSPTGGDYFRLRIGTNAANEVARVTARSGDVCTCDALASNHAAADVVAWTVSGESLEGLRPTAKIAALDSLAWAANSLFLMTGANTVVAAALSGYAQSVLGIYDPASYAGLVMADLPVWYYQLEETSGLVALNSATHATDAAYSSNITLGASGLVSTGKSAQFNGGGAVTCPGNTAFSNAATITVELFFKAASWPASNGAYVLFNMNTNSGGTTGFTLQLTKPSGVSQIALAGRSKSADSWQELDYNFSDTAAAHHLTAEINFTAKTMKLWVDNSLVANSSGKSFGNNSFTVDSSSAAMMGGTTSNFYSGKLDEVAVYDKVLSDARRTAHYNAR